MRVIRRMLIGVALLTLSIVLFSQLYWSALCAVPEIAAWSLVHNPLTESASERACIRHGCAIVPPLLRFTQNLTCLQYSARLASVLGGVRCERTTEIVQRLKSQQGVEAICLGWAIAAQHGMVCQQELSREGLPLRVLFVKTQEEWGHAQELSAIVLAELATEALDELIQDALKNPELDVRAREILEDTLVHSARSKP